MDAQLKKGLLEGLVLNTLVAGESYGYKIIQDISKHIEISESTLYPILKRLEAVECVVARSVEYNGRLRKYYCITELGKEKINSFKQDLDEIRGIYESMWPQESGGNNV